MKPMRHPWVNRRPTSCEMFDAEGSPPADIIVREDDLITVGDISLKVIHTPGHSPGASACTRNGLGLHRRYALCRGCGRTDMEGGSWQVLVNWIRDKLFTFRILR